MLFTGFVSFDLVWCGLVWFGLVFDQKICQDNDDDVRFLMLHSDKKEVILFLICFPYNLVYCLLICYYFSVI